MSEQVIVNSIISASIVALAGVSFYLPFSVARFFHFTHGAAYAVGAYTAFVLAEKAQYSLWLAVLFCVSISALLGLLLDVLIYRRMQRGGAGPFVLLLASLGAYILIQNLLSLAFGDGAVSITASRDWGTFKVMGAWITAAQLLQIGIALFVSAFVHIILKNTRTGLNMTAVGHDRVLAKCVGVRTDYMVTLAFAGGYGLAGLAGLLAALNVDAVPNMGMRPMMLAMVAIVIGGNSLMGAVSGATLVGFGQHFGVLWLPTQWQDAIIFAILILFLLFRPQGFFGIPLRRATV